MPEITRCLFKKDLNDFQSLIPGNVLKLWGGQYDYNYNTVEMKRSEINIKPTPLNILNTLDAVLIFDYIFSLGVEVFDGVVESFEEKPNKKSTTKVIVERLNIASLSSIYGYLFESNSSSKESTTQASNTGLELLSPFDTSYSINTH